MEIIERRLDDDEAQLYKKYLVQEKVKNTIRDSGIFAEGEYPEPDKVVVYRFLNQIGPQDFDAELEQNETEDVDSQDETIVEQTSMFFLFGNYGYINILKNNNIDADRLNTIIQVRYLSESNGEKTENSVLYENYELLDRYSAPTTLTAVELPIEEMEDQPEDVEE
ncbi:hypothetical protein DTX80_17605 [Bacilli bacterium]|uniref:hypothetical protein n=1 Tax=Oceanobacillus TaxID=182709 RepID=UPI0006213D1D|nr:hypothetical protein WH51_14280 [Bacilli bacterium VT-13-104]PZD83287.1 hypothetical protein DEJ64_15580 [Bacilli bacterium]PZD84471.1 hypothetical protein DEJ60_14660 [Bacilli bacterium]PZD86661.1 hypothetical protein DEJ66_15070 [Bacilli bacterium]RCO04351.1 hypothetical protein DTX80_17605 [Bacilli bacterium]